MREKHEKDVQSKPSSRSLASRVAKPHRRSKKKEQAVLSFEEAYGFRGSNPLFIHLSPWEFTQWWCWTRVLTPADYQKRGVKSRSDWTPDGQEWLALPAGPNKPAALPGVHFQVREPEPGCKEYATFPDEDATAQIRHSFLLERHKRPMVPQPDGTPMPSPKLEAEVRCRILNVYLRPWVLHRNHASAHVPHLADIDRKVTDLLGPQICVQKRRIVPKGAKKTFFVCSHEQAWNDYTQHHVVSHHAARVIKNFLSTQLAEAAEAQVDDEGPQEREQWSAIDVSWVDRESVDNILQKGVSWKQKDSTSTKAV